MKIFGILGPIGSGKGTAAKHVSKKYGYKIIVMGNLVRELAKKLKISTTRGNLQALQKKYRKKYGDYFFINLAIEKAKKYEKAIIDGIRTPYDARGAKAGGAKLILIDASPEVRFKRMKKRRRAGFSKTLEQFNKEEASEWKIFNFKKTLGYVDYRIFNNGGKTELCIDVDKLMKRIN
jgi:dephospho-CoA kinase